MYMTEMVRARWYSHRADRRVRNSQKRCRSQENGQEMVKNEVEVAIVRSLDLALGGNMRHPEDGVVVGALGPPQLEVGLKIGMLDRLVVRAPAVDQLLPAGRRE